MKSVYLQNYILHFLWYNVFSDWTAVFQTFTSECHRSPVVQNHFLYFFAFPWYLSNDSLLSVQQSGCAVELKLSCDSALSCWIVGAGHSWFSVFWYVESSCPHGCWCLQVQSSICDWFERWDKLWILSFKPQTQTPSYFVWLLFYNLLAVFYL